MNASSPLRLRPLLLALLLPLGAHAGVKEDLDAVIAPIMAKIKAGQQTEAVLAGDIAKFDALLAAHKDEKTDDVAKILVMKATLYTQIIGDDEKGLAAFQQLKSDFPESSFAKDPNFAAMMGTLETQRAFGVGKVFPDFSEQDMNGKPLSIANYKGKVVLIDFWATWCGPCLAELPNVVEAYKKYHERGFEIIGVSLDRADAREKLVEFTKNREMPWPQFYDGKYWENKLSTKYGIRSIPATFLLDGEGRVIAKNLRGAALDAELAKRLPAK
jgi:thiol-disulfide isomerase/thioredoxin